MLYGLPDGNTIFPVTFPEGITGGGVGVGVSESAAFFLQPNKHTAAKNKIKSLIENDFECASLLTVNEGYLFYCNNTNKGVILSQKKRIKKPLLLRVK